jgi:hypothetical protein
MTKKKALQRILPEMISHLTKVPRKNSQDFTFFCHMHWTWESVCNVFYNHYFFDLTVFHAVWLQLSHNYVQSSQGVQSFHNSEYAVLSHFCPLIMSSLTWTNHSFCSYWSPFSNVYIKILSRQCQFILILM